MIKRTFFLLLGATLSAAACHNTWRSNLSNYADTRDKTLFIACQVAEDTSSKENDMLDIKVRIIPVVQTDESLFKLNELMWYKADSCFTLNAGPFNVMAENCISVATGIKSVYEYNLLFKAAPRMKNEKKWVLNYRNQQISPRTYKLSLTQ